MAPKTSWPKTDANAVAGDIIPEDDEVSAANVDASMVFWSVGENIPKSGLIDEGSLLKYCSC